MKFASSIALVVFLTAVTAGCQVSQVRPTPIAQVQETSDEALIGKRSAMIRGASPFDIHLQANHRFERPSPGGEGTIGTWTRRGNQVVMINDLNGELRGYSVWKILWHQGQVCLVQEIEGQFIDKAARRGGQASLQAAPGEFVDQVLRR